jgi:hypothetical protein
VEKVTEYATLKGMDATTSSAVIRVRFPCVVDDAIRGRVIRIGCRGAVVDLPQRQDLPGRLLFEFGIRGARVKFRAQALVEHSRFRHGVTRVSLSFENGMLIRT